MTLENLYTIADNNEIEIMNINCQNSKSISIMTETNNCYIGIDKNVISEQDKKFMLAHELGHCQTGAFYNRYSKLNVIDKLEHKADKWAIKKLLPVDKLKEAIKDGYTEKWQLAEYFELTEDLIKKAFWIYFDKEI